MFDNKKNIIGLDFILFFILVVNFVLTIQRWHYVGFIPIQGPPKNFIFFFFAFIAIIVYFFVGKSGLKENRKHIIKLSIIGFIILFTAFSLLVYQIALRQAGASLDYIHDGAVETEEAIKFLSQGKNPYAVDYRNTPFGYFIDEYSQGERENPAWMHYVYLPFLPLFSLPFYQLFNNLVSFYDQRILYGLIFLATLFIIYKLPEDKNKKLIGLVAFAFNPIFFPYFVHGYNDIFVFFWLIGSIYFLKIKKYYWSFGFLALACASKQSAWLILPFYFAYLLYYEDKLKGWKQKFTGILKKSIPFIIVTPIIFIPFLVWGFNDFIDDIYRYPAGLIESNFPIIGYGISHLVYLVGLVDTIWDYFPFWILQLIVGIPLIYYLLNKQKESNTLRMLLLNYGIFLFVFWFFSRFFNDNYISYLTLIFLSSYLVEERPPFKIANNL